MSNPIMDQYEAASREAEAAFARAIEESSDTHTARPVGHVVDTVAKRFLDAHHSDGKSCIHVANAPQIVYGIASLPGVIMCQLCASMRLMLNNAQRQMENKGMTCDACGQEVDKWISGIAQGGPIFLTITLCEFCNSMNEAIPRQHDGCGCADDVQNKKEDDNGG